MDTSAKTPLDRLKAVSAQQPGALPPAFEVGIRMRDGVELAADIYLPEETALPVPAIVQSTPYDKSNPSFFVPEARFFQSQGYAFVLHDVRGRGKSEGEWRAWVNDGVDGHDVIEWTAAQAWCTGKVGTTGISYMGWTQWATAAERPPHLRCMVSTSAAGRWHQEIPYTNGIFQLYFVWWAYMVRRRITEFYDLARIDWDEVLRRLPVGSIGDFIDPEGRTWQDMMDHDTLDEFWRSLRFDDRYGDIDVPCLHVTGWFDHEDLLGEFHHYENMVAHSPAKAAQHLLVGPWSHLNSRFPHSAFGGLEFGDAAAVDMDRVHLRWFDHWLKGADNGVVDEPPVRLFETGSNVWREGDRWPAGGGETTLFLRYDGTDGGLDVAPGSADPERSYRYDPLDPAPTQVDVRKYPFEDVPLDQGPVEARDDVVVYTGPALTEALRVTGWPHLELHAATDGDDTDWHVKLTDVHPDGRSVKVSQGCLRAACRDSLQHPTPLVPGQVYAFDVELWPVNHVFLPGHRVRVSVTSSDFPWFARSLNRFGRIETLDDPRPAINTLYHGSATPSRIRLPGAR